MTAAGHGGAGAAGRAGERRAVRWWLLLAVVAGPVLVAAVSLGHPRRFEADAATQWRVVHLVLLPLFPLLGLSVWLLLREHGRGVTRVVAGVSRVLVYVYAVFYTGLDLVAGVANGVLAEQAVRTGDDVGPQVGALFAQAGVLGDVGAWSLVAAAVGAGVLQVRHSGPWALPGAVLLVVAAWSFVDSHVYWPGGVLTVLGLGLGAALMVLAQPAARDGVAAGP